MTIQQHPDSYLLLFQAKHIILELPITVHTLTLYQKNSLHYGMVGGIMNKCRLLRALLGQVFTVS